MEENTQKPTGGSTGKVVGTVVAIIIVAAIVFFASNGKKDSTEVVGTNTTPPPSTANNEAQPQSLKTLLAGNKNQRCTYTSNEDGGSSQGTVYVSAGKMRGDFTVTTQGKTYPSHMIVTNDTSYMWTDGDKSGYKMAVNTKNEKSANDQNTVDPEKNFNFRCEDWNKDDSQFALPTGVQFQDVSGVAPSPIPGQGGAGGSVDMKAVCNNLQEPEKTQCLNALQ